MKALIIKTFHFHILQNLSPKNILFHNRNTIITPKAISKTPSDIRFIFKFLPIVSKFTSVVSCSFPNHYIWLTYLFSLSV